MPKTDDNWMKLKEMEAKLELEIPDSGENLNYCREIDLKAIEIEK